MSSLTVERPLPVMLDHLATRSGHHLAAHHQNAVLVAGDEALHHHVAALGVRHVVGLLRCLSSCAGPASRPGHGCRPMA